MIDQTRTDLLKAIEEFWRHYPELRFGQMVANLADWARDFGPDAVGRVEDDELLAAIREHPIRHRDDTDPDDQPVPRNEERTTSDNAKVG